MSVYRVGEKFRVAFGKDKKGWKLTRWVAVYKCECGTSFAMQCRSECGTKSCGCLAKETARKLLTGNKHRETHGAINTGSYKTWRSMRGRCNDKNNNEFHRYGGRGIKICDQWNSFDCFVSDMGERPAGTSIDRINNDGNYEPSNCRWATAKEQSRNKRSNRFIEIDGKRKSLAEWAECNGAAKSTTIRKRLLKNVIPEEAVFEKTR
jgi:hypothetical protein